MTRSGHLQGIKFTANDLRANADKQMPCRILNAPNVAPEGLPEEVRQYVTHGEEHGYHRGYKCRIRNRWYVVPSMWVPDAFMLRQVHAYPKVVLNQTEATSTDTIHRVRFKAPASPNLVTSAFINSLTFAFTEVVGRSYGGGVLELEPNEAETLPLPLMGAENLELETLHDLMKAGDVDRALSITDNVLLHHGLGLAQSDIVKLRGIWTKLRDRRINRKR